MTIERYAKGMHTEGLSTLIIDILETYFGEWFSWGDLEQHIGEHRGDRYSDLVVRRTVQRLIDKGLVERRMMTARSRGDKVVDIIQIRRPWRSYLVCESLPAAG